MLAQARDVLISVLTLGAAWLAGLLAHAVLFRLLPRWARRTELDLDDLLVEHCKAPTRIVLPLAITLAAAPAVPLPASIRQLVAQGLGIAFIGALGWLAWRLVHVARLVMLSRFDIDEADNLKARTVHTQVRVIERIAQAVIVVVAISAALMTFERVRQVGVSLLASAGIAGMVLGFAAQKSLSTLFAGLQIALTQPIRIDDVVIVEGEWGRVEEITLTYVIIRIWDQRRLVVPITWFIDNAFQNWTRVSAEILGTVTLHVDHRVPTSAVRERLHETLKGTELWDRRSWGLQVTEAGPGTITLRALMSAADASRAWDLRCLVREALVAWLQEQHPGSLPRVRGEIASWPSEPTPGS